MLKPNVKFNTQIRIKDKDGKALYKLINNAIPAKAMENLRNRIDARPASNKRDYLKLTSKPSNMSQKIKNIGQ